jgi:protein associated with RNAse G/E
MTSDQVRVVYTKFDGSLHWHQTMTRLGEDRHGVWLGAPPGIIARKGHDGPPVVIEQAHVLLFPRDAWWTAVFNGLPNRIEIYCDITGPITWPHDGEVTMVDLDLDVARLRADGRVELWDEDEFAEHQLRYAYPPDVIRRASEAAAWLYAALGDGTEPFATDYKSWLARVDQAATSSF